MGGVTDSIIDTEVPEDLEEGIVSVEATIGEQTVTEPNFAVERAAPGISFVDPESGTVGTEVTIEGMNYSSTPSENEVRFAGTEARSRVPRRTNFRRKYVPERQTGRQM